MHSHEKVSLVINIKKHSKSFFIKSIKEFESACRNFLWSFTFAANVSICVQAGLWNCLLSPTPNALKIRKLWITHQHRLTQIHCYGPFRFHQFRCRPSLLDRYFFYVLCPKCLLWFIISCYFCWHTKMSLWPIVLGCSKSSRYCQLLLLLIILLESFIQ